MANVVRHERYVKTAANTNNNKFWYITEFDDASVVLEWGRVGKNPATTTKQFPSQQKATKFFDSKVRQKLKDGRKGEIAYRKIEVVEESIQTQPRVDLAEIAKRDICPDSQETLELVTYLAEQNVHNILDNTTMSFNHNSGLFETACGVVTQNTVDKARRKLEDIANFVTRHEKHPSHDLLKSDEYVEILCDYLMLIPQDIGYKLDPTRLFTKIEDIRKQNSILDSLDASIQSIEADREILVKSVEQDEHPQLFRTEIQTVNDGKVIDRIRKLYESTRKGIHSCSHLKVDSVFAVTVQDMYEAFEKAGRPLGNVWELWHGTRVSNLLSILKSGLMVPPTNAGHVTGRMFGNGVYFSDQSTKALNYAYGYWGGTKDNQCFMFLADVAMGKYYVPNSSGSYRPDNCDSIFAKGSTNSNRYGISGVMNNEMIVPNTYQCNLKYLVKFSG